MVYNNLQQLLDEVKCKTMVYKCKSPIYMWKLVIYSKNKIWKKKVLPPQCQAKFMRRTLVNLEFSTLQL